MNKSVSFLNNQFQRLFFSVFVVTGVIFVSGMQSATGYCTGTFGVSAKVECSAVMAGAESVLSWIAMSSYFALLPVLIPILMVWGIMELLFWLTQKNRKPVTAMPPAPKL